MQKFFFLCVLCCHLAGCKSTPMAIYNDNVPPNKYDYLTEAVMFSLMPERHQKAEKKIIAESIDVWRRPHRYKLDTNPLLERAQAEGCVDLIRYLKEERKKRNMSRLAKFRYLLETEKDLPFKADVEQAVKELEREWMSLKIEWGLECCDEHADEKEN